MPQPALCRFIAIAVLAGSGLSSAHAQSIRCGNQLVSVGDQSDDVLRKCGEPVKRDRSCDVLQVVGTVNQCTDVERWTYRWQLTTILSFQDGQLVKITYGSRQ